MKQNSEKSSEDTNDFWSKLLKITIAKVTVLRKRSGSNVRCDDQLVDDDAKFKDEIIKHINCTPPYWRPSDLPRTLCQSKEDLQNAETFIQEFRAVLTSYIAPCVQMEVVTKYDREEQNEGENPRIMFRYEDKEYEEIQNTKSFDLESFVSGVGGFIGIFLGYSILQLPELLEALTSLIIKLRHRPKNGKKNRFGICIMD